MKRRHHRFRMEIVQTHKTAYDIGQRVGNGGLGGVGEVRRAVCLVAVDFRPERAGNLPCGTTERDPVPATPGFVYGKPL